MKQEKNEMSRGFTLIELLIVVAIIAILAAIAVPNFMEAQIRSKVSRAMSDQRSLATAIESYTVDNNRPPIGFSEGDSGPAGNLWNGWDATEPRANVDKWANYRYITTPIAYITSIPRDPFVIRNSESTLGQNNNLSYVCYTKYLYTYYYTKNANNSDYNPGLVAQSLGFRWDIASVGPSLKVNAEGSPNWTSNFGWPGISGSWSESSAQGGFQGPHMVRDYICAGRLEGFYDATNGTRSLGYIARSSKGTLPTGVKSPR
ncbi:TPA: hypothetical protein DDW35_03155 [Candidatus Sumerlaeota bacterium]|jgi:prepilin-type N-terminal cleavage/methylation domain-containing protein|nr:hypothetical protein [Candidatus Sumerlaeota bacterium]